MSELHIGTKLVLATLMARADYNNYRGWALPVDEDGSDEGYLIEYVDGGESNHPNHKGYISWSPVAVFNVAYKSSGNLTFGMAIEAMKRGRRVARSGWNGKGMWIILNEGRTVESLEPNSFYDKCGFKAPVFIGSHIDMKAADGSMVVGWLASQTDMLAEDWCIVEFF